MPVTLHFLQLTFMPAQVENASTLRACSTSQSALGDTASTLSAYAAELVV